MVTLPWELDPRWQAANRDWHRDDYPNATAAHAARTAAAAVMHEIESAYESGQVEAVCPACGQVRPSTAKSVLTAL